MRLHIPTGLTAVLASFERILTTLQSLGAERQGLVSDAFCARLEPAQRHLRSFSERQAVLKHAWRQALNIRNEELDQLRRLVRDGWLMLRRRDQREHHGGRLIDHYQLPSLAPPHASAAVWLQHARNLVSGEVRAVAEGHAPMAFPSAAELADCLERAARAEADYQVQSLELKLIETELRDQQRRAVHLLRCLAARLRESQFDQSPARVRNLLRIFGYRFKATPSDDPETLAEQAQAEQIQPVAASEPAAVEAQTRAKESAPTLEHQPQQQGPEPPKAAGWIDAWRAWVRTPKPNHQARSQAS